MTTRRLSPNRSAALTRLGEGSRASPPAGGVPAGARGAHSPRCEPGGSGPFSFGIPLIGLVLRSSVWLNKLTIGLSNSWLAFLSKEFFRSGAGADSSRSQVGLRRPRPRAQTSSTHEPATFANGRDSIRHFDAANRQSTRRQKHEKRAATRALFRETSLCGRCSRRAASASRS